jgi:ABC-type branched-subunit amino acid transport system substrate-binding protein
MGLPASSTGKDVRMLQRLHHRSASVLIILVAALALTCGSASGSGPKTIHLGVLRPFTGQFASVGQAARDGARAAEKAVNSSGGILGGKLVIDSADTLGDPADAVPALNHLLSIDKVSGIIGPGGAEIQAVQPILDRRHIPFMFGGGSLTFDTNKDPWFWRVTPSDSQLGVAMALYAHLHGYKHAAMMFSTIESAQTLKAPIESTFKKLGGTIVASEDLAPNQLSYRSEVLKVHQASPDVVFTQMEPGTASVVVSNFNELGGMIPMVGSDISAGSDFIQAITPAVAQKYVVSLVGSSAPGLGTQSFLHYFQQVYHTREAPAGATYAYDATIVLALAIDKAKSTKPTKIRAAIAAVSNPPGKVVRDYKSGLAALKAGKDINFQGSSGPMDFNSFHNVFGPFDVVQSDGGAGLTTKTTLSANAVAAAAKG